MEYSELKEWINFILEDIAATEDLDCKIGIINHLRSEIHKISPFKNEPVDFVEWVKSDNVGANDYNPNSVAPPEMELLKHSILQDGYTQPVVTWQAEETREVVDGFHRHRVGLESKDVKTRILGYLPVVTIKKEREGRNDRIASTIRHNRARGKHQVDSMSDIVIELKKRNWSSSRISKELGMDADEVLRLCQISGLTEVFADTEFSEAWESGIFNDDEFNGLTESEIKDSSETNRILHTWDEWECHPAGFYGIHAPNGWSMDDAQAAYRDFLMDTALFEKALDKVLKEWVNSCEHYLTNERMNRIAWLGQAAACIQTGLPSKFKGGYNLLTDDQKLIADNTALKYLNIWLESNDQKTLTLEEAQSKTEADLY